MTLINVLCFIQKRFFFYFYFFLFIPKFILAVFVTHEETAFEKSQESFHGNSYLEIIFIGEQQYHAVTISLHSNWIKRYYTVLIIPSDTIRIMV